MQGWFSIQKSINVTQDEKSQKHHTEQKKEKQEHIFYDSIYVKFCNEKYNLP